MARASRAAVLPIAIGLVLGVVAEWAALYRQPLEAPVTAHAFDLAAADFLVGVTLVVCGSLIWTRQDHVRIGRLLVAAGLVWFLGTFADSSIGAAATLGAAFVTLHRGPLVHAVFSYPTGSLRRRLDGWLVAVSYVAAAIPALADQREVSVALAAVVLLAALRARARSTATQRPARATALAAAAGFAVALVAGATFRAGGPWTYDVAIAAIAVAFFVDTARGRWTDDAVTGVVVDLGDLPEHGSLRDRLAATLGDPSVEVGYWLPEQENFFDETGRRLDVHTLGSGRDLTVVRDRGVPVAALVHDAALAEDRGFMTSVASAARLAVSNVRLQAEIRSQVAEVRASRRRLLDASDQELRRLEHELREGPEAQLAHVHALLAAAAGRRGSDELFAEAVAEVGRAREELQEFARGVHPRLLTEGGLSVALEELARRAGVRVELHVAGDRPAPAVEAAAYFVCSEALANAAKHACASNVRIDVGRSDSTIVVAIRDNGRGGATLDAGTGLRGLGDRVEALGGGFTIHSPSGRGTLVTAELPLP
ncbi:MAG: sensor histidine kinase [Gaiellaceae bacterium]